MKGEHSVKPLPACPASSRTPERWNTSLWGGQLAALQGQGSLFRNANDSGPWTWVPLDLEFKAVLSTLTAPSPQLTRAPQHVNRWGFFCPFHQNSLGHAAERAFLPQTRTTAWTSHTRGEPRNYLKPVLLFFPDSCLQCSCLSTPRGGHIAMATQSHCTTQHQSMWADGPSRTVWWPSSGRRKPFHQLSHLCGRPGTEGMGLGCLCPQLLLDTHYSSPGHEDSVLQLWPGPTRHSRLARELDSHMFLSQPVSLTGMGSALRGLGRSPVTLFTPSHTPLPDPIP